MTNEEISKKIVEDVDGRGLDICGVITVDPRTGTMKIITYTRKGLVDTISQEEKCIAFYGKKNPETGAMHEIITLSGNKRTPTPVTKLEIVE